MSHRYIISRADAPELPYQYERRAASASRDIDIIHSFYEAKRFRARR